MLEFEYIGSDISDGPNFKKKINDMKCAEIDIKITFLRFLFFNLRAISRERVSETTLFNKRPLLLSLPPSKPTTIPPPS